MTAANDYYCSLTPKFSEVTSVKPHCHHHHVHFNGRFPDLPASASSPSLFFLHSPWKRTFRGKWPGAGYPSCHPTNSVKALRETQSTDHNTWPGLGQISQESTVLEFVEEVLTSRMAFLLLYQQCQGT